MPIQQIDTTALYDQLQAQVDANIELIQRAIEDTEAEYLQGQIDDIQAMTNDEIYSIVGGSL